MANAIRALAIDAGEAARSGHPGMPMGTADVATALWTRFHKFHAADTHPAASIRLSSLVPELERLPETRLPQLLQWGTVSGRSDSNRHPIPRLDGGVVQPRRPAAVEADNAFDIDACIGYNDII